jgi:hypothetical protein
VDNDVAAVSGNLDVGGGVGVSPFVKAVDVHP